MMFSSRSRAHTHTPPDQSNLRVTQPLSNTVTAPAVAHHGALMKPPLLLLPLLPQQLRLLQALLTFHCAPRKHCQDTELHRVICVHIEILRQNLP